MIGVPSNPSHAGHLEQELPHPSPWKRTENNCSDFYLKYVKQLRKQFLRKPVQGQERGYDIHKPFQLLLGERSLFVPEGTGAEGQQVCRTLVLSENGKFL